MIKKPILRFVFAALFLSMAACAPAAQPAAASPTPASSSATADRNMAIPKVGFGTVIAQQGAPAQFLRSRPDPNSPITATVQAGETGKILGVDATGKWVLIDFKNRVGWIPIQLLDYNIAE
jgi:uncharacterized protein YgiM (DUF1202 family)